MRIYLHKIDSEDARTCHAVRDIKLLEHELKNLPLTELMTIDRRSEICSAFELAFVTRAVDA